MLAIAKTPAIAGLPATAVTKAIAVKPATSNRNRDDFMTLQQLKP
jgi:hypothetical protein